MANETLTDWIHNSGTGKGTVDANLYAIDNCEAANDTEFIADDTIDVWDGDFGEFSIDFRMRSGTIQFANVSAFLMVNDIEDRAMAAAKAHIILQAFKDTATTRRFTFGQWTGTAWDSLSSNYYFLEDIWYTLKISRTGNLSLCRIFMGEALQSTISFSSAIVRSFDTSSLGVYGDINIAGRQAYADWRNVDLLRAVVKTPFHLFGRVR